MKSIAVIAISTSCLDYLNIEADNLTIVRSNIIMGETQYKDYVEMDSDGFYQKLQEHKNLVPTSSMPSVGDFMNAYETLEEKGYKEVIVITLSSTLSGAYQTAQMGKNQYEGALKITLFDTKNAGIGEGFFTLEALKMIEAGKSLDDVISALKTLRENRKQFFMVDDLEHLVKNGRLSGIGGFFGGLFKIKPILTLNDDGRIVPFEKVRTRNKAIERMAEWIIEGVKNHSNYLIVYNTSDQLEGHEQLKALLDEALPPHKTLVAPISPVIAIQTGPGMVGAAYFITGALK